MNSEPHKQQETHRQEQLIHLYISAQHYLPPLITIHNYINITTLRSIRGTDWWPLRANDEPRAKQDT